MQLEFAVSFPSGPFGTPTRVPRVWSKGASSRFSYQFVDHRHTGATGGILGSNTNWQRVSRVSITLLRRVIHDTLEITIATTCADTGISRAYVPRTVNIPRRTSCRCTTGYFYHGRRYAMRSGLEMTRLLCRKLERWFLMIVLLSI